MKRFASAALASALLLGGGGLAAPAASAASDLGPRGAQYVSIGDSYVAAGALADLYGSRGNPTPSCSQAPDDVGHLVAKRLRVSFADWACSGAETVDVLKNTPKGRQLNGLSGKTRYVSVSIGGNDEMIFGGLMANCLIGALCNTQFREATMAKIDRLGHRLDTVYAAIRTAAPNAKVVVLPYLRVLPGDPRGCFVDGLMGRDAVAFANRAENKLNATIIGAAKRAGFTVADDQQAGHDMCAPDGQRYVSMTGVGPKDDGVPIHPTLAGRQYTADLIAAAFRS